MNMLKKYIVPVIAVLGGLLFIVLGVIGISQTKKFPEIRATVTKVDIDTTIDEEGGATESRTVYVKYNVNGKSYNEILQDSNGKMNEGDIVTVRYNPEKPSYVTATTKTGGLVRIVFGAAILAVGILSVKRIGLKSKEDQT